MQMADVHIKGNTRVVRVYNEFVMSTNPLAIAGVGVSPAFPLRWHNAENGVSWVLWS
jgi:hypothetical protein